MAMTLDPKPVFLMSVVALAGLAACSDSGRRRPTDGGTIEPGDLGYDPNAFFLTDPPPKTCALDGTTFQPVTPPGGTPECPDDKNRAGCPCPAEGMKAPCWPGLRANRGLGICTDGVATCEQHGEFNLSW